MGAKKNKNLPHSFCANDFSSNEFCDVTYKDKLSNFLEAFYN